MWGCDLAMTPIALEGGGRQGMNAGKAREGLERKRRRLATGVQQHMVEETLEAVGPLMVAVCRRTERRCDLKPLDRGHHHGGPWQKNCSGGLWQRQPPCPPAEQMPSRRTLAAEAVAAAFHSGRHGSL